MFFYEQRIVSKADFPQKQKQNEYIRDTIKHILLTTFERVWKTKSMYK